MIALKVIMLCGCAYYHKVELVICSQSLLKLSMRLSDSYNHLFLAHNQQHQHNNLPHSVKQSAIVLKPQQLVGSSHVMSDRLLAVKKESVGGPDVARQKVI